MAGAAAGTLTFMFGAETDQRVQPILECMEKSNFTVTRWELANCDVCNNMVLAIEMIGIS